MNDYYSAVTNQLKKPGNSTYDIVKETGKQYIRYRKKKDGIVYDIVAKSYVRVSMEKSRDSWFTIS